MSLTLYIHPLASFCHKVMIAFHENGVPFAQETVDLMDAGSAASHLARWPVGKIPVLYDDESKRVVPETSIIIEYVAERLGDPAGLLPADTETRLEARLWDRFFDLYVSQPMQKIVTDRIRPEGGSDPVGVAEARRTLDTAYAMIEERMAGRTFACGEGFTIADCAAFPGLFFAGIVHPFPSQAASLAAYFERLLARPSVQATLAQARPWFSMFPYRDAMPDRFLAG